MNDLLNRWGSAFLAGACGAVALTVVHQLARRMSDDAPRLDVMGERAIERSLQAAGAQVPPPQQLHQWALAGDLLANSAFYSLVTCGRDAHVWRRGIVLGLGAGACALLLPKQVGLGDPPKSDHLANQIMTVAWYLVGGLAAAAAGQGLQRTTRPLAA